MTLLTRAEASRWQETSLHADVVGFIERLRERADARLHVGEFGRSPEGRALPLLVLNADGLHTPAQARAKGLPVVLIINGIHAGEVEGKEASLMLTRAMLSGDEGDVLKKMVLVIVPLFNPDGNDRIDPANRRLDITKLEGQIGPPSGVGTRVNASGVNLNRDYMRQEALEMRLLQTQVCHVWKPDLTIDCHSTNGSVHRFALTYDIPHTVASGRPEPIAFMREHFLPTVRERVKRLHGRDTFYYGNFVTDEGGTGDGWMTYPHHPRFGSNYRGLTGRCDLLLETCSYLEFPERVATTYDFLWESLLRVQEVGDELVATVSAAQTPRRDVAVSYRLDAFDEPVEILTRAPRTLDGAPIAVTIPHFANFVATDVVARPWAYAVPTALADRLRAHGLQVDEVERDVHASVEVAIVEGTVDESSRKILESSSDSERRLTANHTAQFRRLPAGTSIVRTDQPLGAIAVYLCEPHSDDSAYVCGFLDDLTEGDEFPAWRVLEPVSIPAGTGRNA